MSGLSRGAYSRETIKISARGVWEKAIMETDSHRKEHTMSFPPIQCKGCECLWPLEQLYCVKGADKDGCYCFTCTEHLQQEVSPENIAIRPAGERALLEHYDPSQERGWGSSS